jgi:hypothetical protein
MDTRECLSYDVHMRMALCFVLAIQVLAAQSRKKVYISIDLEGISGISGPDQLHKASRSTRVRAS